MEASKAVLFRAIHLDPGNFELRFNAAFCLQVPGLLFSIVESLL